MHGPGRSIPVALSFIRAMSQLILAQHLTFNVDVSGYGLTRMKPHAVAHSGYWQRVDIGKGRTSARGATVRVRWGIGRREIPLAREVPPHDRRVKITMSVTFAPELAEAIKEPAQRQGLPADDWVVAAAELKFRADDEAEAFEEAEGKRRLVLWREYTDTNTRRSTRPSSAPSPRKRWQRRRSGGKRRTGGPKSTGPETSHTPATPATRGSCARRQGSRRWRSAADPGVTTAGCARQWRTRLRSVRKNR